MKGLYWEESQRVEECVLEQGNQAGSFCRKQTRADMGLAQACIRQVGRDLGDRYVLKVELSRFPEIGYGM